MTNKKSSNYFLLKFKYMIIPVALLMLSGFFLYKHFERKSTVAEQLPDKKEFEFRINQWNDMPYFYCKGKTKYTFTSTGDIKKVYIGNSWSANYPIGKSFSIELESPERVKVETELQGVFWKKGLVTVKEGVAEAPRWTFGYLPAKQLSPFSINVKKGQRLDLAKQNELYYLIYFRSGVEKKRELVKNDGNYFFWFWHDYELKIMPAEVGFSFVGAISPYYESLAVNDKNYGKAIFLAEGETFETPLYIDRWDDISLKSREKWIDNSDYHIMVGKTDYDKIDTPYDSGGMLTIKAIKPIVITELSVHRNTRWSFKLKQDEEDKFHVFSGDIITSRSNSRYFVDGNIVEANKSNKYLSCSDRDIIFKGSVNPEEIIVTVEKRKGF